jgi:hypothetical protein
MALIGKQLSGLDWPIASRLSSILALLSIARSVIRRIVHVLSAAICIAKEPNPEGRFSIGMVGANCAIKEKVIVTLGRAVGTIVKHPAKTV